MVFKKQKTREFILSTGRLSDWEIWTAKYYDLYENEKQFKPTKDNLDFLYHIHDLKMLDFASLDHNRGLNKKGYDYFRSSGIEFTRIYNRRPNYAPHVPHANPYVYDFVGIRITNEEDNLLFKLYAK